MLPSLFSIFVLFMKHLFELFSRSQNQIPKSILIAGFAGIFSMENSIYFSLEHVPYILVANQMTGHQISHQ